MPRTLIIGRSPFADVVIADPSVAPHHLELVITDRGRLHVTDCAGPGGTWRHARGSAAVDAPAGASGAATVEVSWEPIRQAFVEADAPLRLGEHVTTSMIFDAGVYLAVLGMIAAAINNLGVKK